MKDFTVNGVERILGFKLLVLTTVVISLTLARPAALTAHKGAQKLCSFVMQTEDCGKHC